MAEKLNTRIIGSLLTLNKLVLELKEAKGDEFPLILDKLFKQKEEVSKLIQEFQDRKTKAEMKELLDLVPDLREKP